MWLSYSRTYLVFAFVCLQKQDAEDTCPLKARSLLCSWPDSGVVPALFFFLLVVWNDAIVSSETTRNQILTRRCFFGYDGVI